MQHRPYKQDVIGVEMCKNKGCVYHIQRITRVRIKRMNQKWKDILFSFYENAIPWTLFFLCSIWLCDGNIAQGIVAFLYAYFINYLGHTLLHSEYTYYNMYSIPHCYHHSNDHWSTYVTNIIAEISMMTGFLMIPKYIYLTYPWTIWINEWVLCFNSILYTTVHYINYTYHKVNAYHVKHHEKYDTNYFPDIFDAIFETKHKDTGAQESIEHKIPNIIVAFLIVFFMKIIYDGQSDPVQQLWKEIVLVVWIMATFGLTLVSMKIVKQQIDDNFESTEWVPTQ